MTINKLMMAVLLLLALNTSAQMTPARSDAYQGNYNIRTGIGNPEWLKPSVYFKLYSNLHLVKSSPTGSTVHNTALYIPGASSYPFFYSYKDAMGLDSTFNWFNWGYNNGAGATFYYNQGKTPSEADAAGTKGYKEYNKYYGLGNNELTLSTDALSPSILHNRINQKRDGILLSLYTLYTLEGKLLNPMTDLRIQGMDNSVQLLYRNWFNCPFLVDNAGNVTTGAEYSKMSAANNLSATENAKNSGDGTSIIDFNKNFDGYMSTYSPKIGWNTEGAVEITGLRTLNYNADPDAYGISDKKLNIKFRMLTVGGSFYSHTSDPWQISNQHYLDININRPVLAFKTADAGADVYHGTALSANKGAAASVLAPINFDISETSGALIPGTETSTQTPVSIDASRVRVSLVTKADYDAAVANGTIATNNDLPVVSGFAYLTQENFQTIANTITQGAYHLKYDYSASDSKTDIKTVGDKLGEVFAKSIYRPFTVDASLSVSFGSINAAITNGKLTVNWTSLTETNNSHFEIEASTDGAHFTKIGEVVSKATNGNSGEVISYTFSKDASSAAAVLGFSLLAIGGWGLGFKRNRKLVFGLVMLAGVATAYTGCTKNDAGQVSNDGKVFIRIAQVDKDGTKQYSKTIQAVKK